MGTAIPLVWTRGQRQVKSKNRVQLIAWDLYMVISSAEHNGKSQNINFALNMMKYTHFYTLPEVWQINLFMKWYSRDICKSIANLHIISMNNRINNPYMRPKFIEYDHFTTHYMTVWILASFLWISCLWFWRGFNAKPWHV